MKFVAAAFAADASIDNRHLQAQIVLVSVWGHNGKDLYKETEKIISLLFCYWVISKSRSRRNLCR